MQKRNLPEGWRQFPTNSSRKKKKKGLHDVRLVLTAGRGLLRTE